MEAFVRPEHLAVCRLPAGSPWPTPPGAGSFLSVTESDGELSIVCPAHLAPPGSQVESGWRALTVVGPLDFSMVGVIARLAGVLAAAGLSVFVISTFDTDHLLVKADALPRAVTALREDGLAIQPDA
jgi:uncharacterized protein